MEGRPEIMIWILMTLLQVKALLDPSAEHAPDDQDCSLQDTGDMHVGSSFNISSLDPDDVGGIRMGGSEGGGLLVLIPEMSFTCQGTVSSWSGVVSVSADSLSESFQMSLQVWRPLQEGSYGLIGSHNLTFDSFDFSQVRPSQEDAKVDSSIDYGRKRYYQFIEEEGTSGSGIPFQKGDIIGCFIPSVSSADLVNTSQASLELTFQNASLHDERRVDLMVFDGVKGEPCETFNCRTSPRTIPSVVPLIRPHCKGLSWRLPPASVPAGWGSGSGSAFGPMPNHTDDTLPRTPVLCEVRNTSCTAAEKYSTGVTGLFAVIAGVCIAATCIVGITANLVTFCIARRRIQRRKREQKLRKGKRFEASCPFITNQLVGPESEDQQVLNERPISTITSLADFLQYSMQTDGLETEATRMSWV